MSLRPGRQLIGRAAGAQCALAHVGVSVHLLELEVSLPVLRAEELEHDFWCERLAAAHVCVIIHVWTEDLQLPVVDLQHRRACVRLQGEKLTWADRALFCQHEQLQRARGGMRTLLSTKPAMQSRHQRCSFEQDTMPSSSG